MSDSNKETLKQLKLLKKQNQIIIMHRIYRLGFDLLSSYMMCRTGEDVEDYHDVTDIEVERISNLIDKTIVKNHQTRELIKQNPEFPLKGLKEVVSMQQERIDEMSIHKDYKNMLKFIDRYINKNYNRVTLGMHFGDDDDEDLFIEDFLQ